MSDNTLKAREILYSPNGARRSDEEVVGLYGVRGLHLALIGEELVKLRDLPPPLSEPTRVFISYCWSTASENEWVARLAHNIRERGYFVYHDRSRRQQAVTTTDIASIVAEIAQSHIFVCVIDPGYIAQVGDRVSLELSKRWAYTEFTFARESPARLGIIGLLRAGEAVPPGMSVADQYHGGSVRDVREPSQLTPVLDAMFPTKESSLNTLQTQHGEALLSQVASSLRESDYAQAFQASELLAKELPSIDDGHALLTVAALRANDLNVAYNQGLTLNPSYAQNRILFAVAALECGKPKEALHVLQDDRSAPAGLASMVKGAALLQLGQDLSAHAHVRLARRRRPLDEMCTELLTQLREDGTIESSGIPSCVSAPLQIPTDFFGPVNHIVALATPSQRSQPMRLHLVSDLAAMQIGRDYDVTLLARLAPRVADLWGPRIPARPFSPTVIECTHCKFLLQVTSHEHALCEGCGAQTLLWDRIENQCSYCGSGGVLGLLPAFGEGYCPCPYCRDGDLYGDKVGLIILEWRQQGGKAGILSEAADLLENWVEAHETAAHTPYFADDAPRAIQRARDAFKPLERLLKTHREPRLDEGRKEIDRMFEVMYPHGGNPYRS
jgi:TIR domain